MPLKTKKFVIILALLVLSIVIFSFRQTNSSNLNNDSPSSVITTSSPKTVIESFIKATLGRVPGAEIDYDKARTLMTTSYAAEFNTPMFIPQAYGMQDGPDNYEVTDEEILTNTATVTVLGHWGADNQMYWVFELKKQAGDWKLDFINPGQ